ncbi:MAG: glycosyltransferase family 2 protein [Bacteroidales bacterium]|nr:glycosyltransferase family 2 protein [Bacteroidales bacterium]
MQKNCIIIPCYNEEKRLPTAEFEDFFIKNPEVDFCFVNDGSKDKTLELLNKLKAKYPNLINVLDLEQNGGKAEAVRQGMLYCLSLNRYKYIGFFDADLATPLSEIHRLIAHINIDENNCISFCSRINRMGAQVERKVSRHYIGRVFSTFAGIILKMPVYDTQCGAKLFRHDIIAVAFSKPFITKWLFDLEIFMRLRNHLTVKIALKSMIEVPVLQWIEKGDSKLSVFYMLKVPIELIKIWLTYSKKEDINPKQR